jgi:hypothetical protein
MLYRVTVFKPARNERHLVASDSHVVGSLRAARLAARALLKPHARRETTYSARTNTRFPHVSICSVPFGAKCAFQGKQIESVEPELTYVPSVGDLGYTP